MRQEQSVACMGVDVHYKFSTVALMDAQCRVVRPERLEHRDREALRKQVRAWPKGLTAVLESSFGWGWLSDVLVEEGVQVRLANCYKSEQMRKARGWVKTNAKDADLLGLLASEASNWWEVWRAPPEVRDGREWRRHRADVVQVQTEIKNRIHAIFHRHGIYHDFSDLFGGEGRLFLSKLAAGEDPQSRHLPPGAMNALRGELWLLAAVRSELARVSAVLRKLLERDGRLQWIKSVPGFGLMLAHVVLAEMGMLGRFRRSRSLAAYALLAPRAEDTGEPKPGKAPIGRHLGTRGKRVLKWSFIEAAHGAVRSGGEFRAFFDRITEGGRHDCQRGYIAVARMLVDVVYAVLRDQRKYQPRQPKASAARPKQARRGRTVAAAGDQTPATASSAGDATNSRSARPGTGRLYRPMVAAGR